MILPDYFHSYHEVVFLYFYDVLKKQFWYLDNRCYQSFGFWMEKHSIGSLATDDFSRDVTAVAMDERYLLPCLIRI